MSIDFAQLASGTTTPRDQEMPAANGIARRKDADPALVELITKAAKDLKRRELPGSFSLTPYEGRKNANEAQTVVNELRRAARVVGVKLMIRKFDVTASTARLTFVVLPATEA